MNLLYHFHLDHLLAHYKRYLIDRHHRRLRRLLDLENLDDLDYLEVDLLVEYFLNHRRGRVEHLRHLNHLVRLYYLDYKMANHRHPLM